ncbi:hypothetical protein SBOR_3031 [Sclerotinia borealis F-4128]|uniref:Uncharacterized protein n=1 Tax=Sclerotinia borealis (strain F-4128) TaxID=1432307 RepID=W9CPH4_SCLBF|nr:hypothetical protein SBOR_3031 [Sclerotinia borealis F-4128]
MLVKAISNHCTFLVGCLLEGTLRLSVPVTQASTAQLSSAQLSSADHSFIFSIMQELGKYTNLATLQGKGATERKSYNLGLQERREKREGRGEGERRERRGERREKRGRGERN